MNNAQKNLRIARIAHIAFCFSAILYILVPLLVIRVPQGPAPREIVFALGVVAFASLGAALFFRARLVQPSSEKLVVSPDDAGAAKQWRAGVILSLVFCESVILFGLALRVLGAGWNVAGVFYAVGIVLMLLWTPKLDLPPQ
jgi:hypothetical protein